MVEEAEVGWDGVARSSGVGVGEGDDDLCAMCVRLLCVSRVPLWFAIANDFGSDVTGNRPESNQRY